MKPSLDFSTPTRAIKTIVRLADALLLQVRINLRRIMTLAWIKIAEDTIPRIRRRTIVHTDMSNPTLVNTKKDLAEVETRVTRQPAAHS